MSMASAGFSRRRRALARRFARGSDGSSAVEFGLVAAPLFGLIYAIFQTTLIFFAGQVFETAVAEAGREIMTGQTKTFTAANFKTAVCSNVPSVFDCNNGIMLDVRSYPDYASAKATPPPLKSGKLDASQFSYSGSTGGQVVVVRAVYPYPVYMRPMGITLSNIDSGANYMLVATTAFRNEPF